MPSDHSAQRELDALREEVRRYRTLFRSIDKGFCLVEVRFEAGEPVDFVFEETNPAFHEQTGLRDVVGRSALDLLPNLEPEWLDLFGGVVATGESVRATGVSRDLGGRWFDVYAFRPGSPTERHVAVLFRDVSEQKQVERQLETLHSRLESALIAGVIGTWEFDVVNDIVWADRNMASLFGIPEVKAARGHHLATYFLGVHPADRETVRETLTATLESGDRYSVEMRALAADGTERHVLARGRVQRDEIGRAVRCPGVVIDFTERRKLEQKIEAQSRKLIDAARRKDQFLAMLSHELRNPMAPIFSALHLLRDVPGDSDTCRNAIDAIDRQMRHLTRLVDDLLEVSRITNGRIHLQTETLDLRDVVERAVERVQPVIDRNRQTLTTTVGDDPLWVCGDPDRLEQAVGNVLHNAAKYSGEGTVVELGAGLEDGRAVVRIRDRGLGIDAELLPRIFDLFTQADESLDRSAGGLGIGLALVQRIVSLHDGTVDASSDGRGHGSRFTLSFPVSEPPCTAQRSPVSEAATVEALRVLVVEDNEDSADLLASVLDLWGHETHVVHDGSAAIEAAAEFQPQVVLLDIGLPKADGYIVARRLREAFAEEPPKLVAVTGYGRPTDRRRAQDAGFDAHLTKPVMMEALEEVLTDLFASP